MHTHIYLGQRGFLRWQFPAAEAEADCSFNPTALYSRSLHLKKKSKNCFRTKLKFSSMALPGPVPKQTPCAIILKFPPAHWCQHMYHRIRVGERAPNSVICHQSFSDASFPWLLGACSLSALHHHCTVHSNYFGCSLQRELFLPFVCGLGVFCFFF